MDNQKAIDELKYQEEMRSNGADYQVNNLVIGAAISALEKQIPKKPAKGEPFSWIDSVKVGRRWKEVRKISYGHACPNCGESTSIAMNFCRSCGQAIDWSES